MGSPPALPGGGITGVLPVSGVGARIAGSTPAGGHSTPSDLANLSPSGSARCSLVVACGAILPWGVDSVGAQLVPRAGAGAAVCAGGVVAVGGACAKAAPDAVMSAHKNKGSDLVISGNGLAGPRFHAKIDARS